jgi:phage pi2 protein 07
MLLLKFNEESHRYYLETEDGSPLPVGFDKPFTSVSKFLDCFREPFDEQAQAEKFVTSKSNKKGLKSKEEVLAYWKLRRDLGTALHAKREAKDIENGAITYCTDDKGDKICFSSTELKNLPDGVYTEITVFLYSAWLIGTADRIEINTRNGIKYVSIFDYKTNGHKLTAEPKKIYSAGKGGSHYKYFYAPINHRPCDSFQGYTYQLSAYAYFFEKLGYVVDKLEIEAIDMDDEGNELKSRMMEVEYRRDEIIQMIEYFKKLKR